MQEFVHRAQVGLSTPMLKPQIAAKVDGRCPAKWMGEPEWLSTRCLHEAVLCRLDMRAPCREPNHPDIARNEVGERHERHLIPEDCIRADIRPPEATSGLQQSLAPMIDLQSYLM